MNAISTRLALPLALRRVRRAGGSVLAFAGIDRHFPSHDHERGAYQHGSRHIHDDHPTALLRGDHGFRGGFRDGPCQW